MPIGWLGTRGTTPGSGPLLLVVLLINEGGQEVNDLLLSSGSLIELAAHLGEPTVHRTFKFVKPASRLLAEAVDR